jgi:hypothetical protein
MLRMGFRCPLVGDKAGAFEVWPNTYGGEGFKHQMNYGNCIHRFNIVAGQQGQATAKRGGRWRRRTTAATKNNQRK